MQLLLHTHVAHFAEDLEPSVEHGVHGAHALTQGCKI